MVAFSQTNLDNEYVSSQCNRDSFFRKEVNTLLSSFFYGIRIAKKCTRQDIDPLLCIS